jgi:hypothetical protein
MGSYFRRFSDGTNSIRAVASQKKMARIERPLSSSLNADHFFRACPPSGFNLCSTCFVLPFCALSQRGSEIVKRLTVHRRGPFAFQVKTFSLAAPAARRLFNRIAYELSLRDFPAQRRLSHQIPQRRFDANCDVDFWLVCPKPLLMCHSVLYNTFAS